MVVLSLFDGISCGRVALERAGIPVTKYYASEIDKHAIKVAQKNYPDTIQLGDVCNVNISNLEFVPNLISAGSPCQGFSFAGKRMNLEDPRSKLFFEFLRLLNEAKSINPNVYFFLENVRMDRRSENFISQTLGVSPIRLNSNVFSYQNRYRLYWTNIPYERPKNKNISFQDYKESGDHLDEYMLKRTKSRVEMWEGGKCKDVTNSKKISCITTKQDRWSNEGLVRHRDFSRFLTIRELEIGQTLPVGYTSILDKVKAAHAIGNGWTVDVIAHFYKNIGRGYKELDYGVHTSIFDLMPT